MNSVRRIVHLSCQLACCKLKFKATSCAVWLSNMQLGFQGEPMAVVLGNTRATVHASHNFTSFSAWAQTLTDADLERVLATVYITEHDRDGPPSLPPLIRGRPVRQFYCHNVGCPKCERGAKWNFQWVCREWTDRTYFQVQQWPTSHEEYFDIRVFSKQSRS